MNLILGLGNPILGDDSAGILAVRGIKGGENFEIKESYYGGMRLLQQILDYERVIIVDAVTGENPGKVSLINREELSEKGHGATVHDVNIDHAIELAEKSGIPLPDIQIIGIEVKPPSEFTEKISEEVAEGIKKARKMVLKIMEGWNENRI